MDTTPTRRDRAMARVAARLRPSGPALRRAGAVLLGWLVLMTVWGFGRAWHGGLAPVELAVGVLAGTGVTWAAWRRAAPASAGGGRG